MKRILFAAALLFVPFCQPVYANNCETARANASSAPELIAKAEGAGFKLTAEAKARIGACFKPAAEAKPKVAARLKKAKRKHQP